MLYKIDSLKWIDVGFSPAYLPSWKCQSHCQNIMELPSAHTISPGESCSKKVVKHSKLSLVAPTWVEQCQSLAVNKELEVLCSRQATWIFPKWTFLLCTFGSSQMPLPAECYVVVSRLGLSCSLHDNEPVNFWCSLSSARRSERRQDRAGHTKLCNILVFQICTHFNQCKRMHATQFYPEFFSLHLHISIRQGTCIRRNWCLSQGVAQLSLTAPPSGPHWHSPPCWTGRLSHFLNGIAST